MRPHVVDSKHEQVSMFALSVGHGGMSLVRNHTPMLSSLKYTAGHLEKSHVSLMGKIMLPFP